MAVKIIGALLTEMYLKDALNQLNIGAIGNLSNINKSVIVIAVFCACYFAIGFANRSPTHLLKKIMYGLSIGAASFYLAVCPNTYTCNINNVEASLLIYLACGATAGLLLGLRFNRLSNI